jgi:RNA polymerase sigma-70 factor (ECF subfamily)
MSDEIEDDEDSAIEEVPKELMNEMIGRLPLRYRVVVNLRAFEELSHKDIALRLDISEKASVTLFSRAKRKLAKMIKEYLNSQGI